MIDSEHYHQILKPQGNDAPESGIPINASCYLYFQGDNGCVVSDRRRSDDVTAQTEFADFRRDQVDQRTDLFIAEIRHAIIAQNEQGEFVEHRISPSVMTDDWVLKATHFVKTISDNEQKEDKGAKIELQMVDKKKRFFYEGWLNVKVNTTQSYSLPLVMFTKKEEDTRLQACLDKIMASVHKAMEDRFPDCTVAPLTTTHTLWDLAHQPNNQKPIGNGDDKLSKALERFKAGIKAEPQPKRLKKVPAIQIQKKVPATQMQAATAERYSYLAQAVLAEDYVDCEIQTAILVEEDTKSKKFSKKKSLWDVTRFKGRKAKETSKAEEVFSIQGVSDQEATDAKKYSKQKSLWASICFKARKAWSFARRRSVGVCAVWKGLLACMAVTSLKALCKDNEKPPKHLFDEHDESTCTSATLEDCLA